MRTTILLLAGMVTEVYVESTTKVDVITVNWFPLIVFLVFLCIAQDAAEIIRGWR